MTTYCECPFCPLDEFGKEFVILVTLVKDSISIKSDIYLPEEVRKACITILRYAKYNCEIKHNQLIQLHEEKVCVHLKKNKKSEVFRICFHPEELEPTLKVVEQPLELVVN